MTTEKRTFPIEFRVDSDEKPKIRGYAAVFGKLSDNLGGFREKIAPGAFRKTLKEADVRALFNHDPNKVLGRTSSGSLSLREDDKGLWMEIEPADTADARDVMALIQRGDVDQASFAFRVVKDTWRHEDEPGTIPVRTLDEVQLFDVSPVTYPAYPQTSVDVRAQMTEDGRFAVEKTYSEPENHSEEPRTEASGEWSFIPAHSEPEPETHSEPEPREHAEYVPRDINVLVKEWRLEVEAGR